MQRGNGTELGTFRPDVMRNNGKRAEMRCESRPKIAERRRDSELSANLCVPPRGMAVERPIGADSQERLQHLGGWQSAAFGHENGSQLPRLVPEAGNASGCLEINGQKREHGGGGTRRNRLGCPTAAWQNRLKRRKDRAFLLA